MKNLVNYLDEYFDENYEEQLSYVKMKSSINVSKEKKDKKITESENKDSKRRKHKKIYNN